MAGLCVFEYHTVRIKRLTVMVGKGQTPMQWDTGENAGFSSGTPWIIPPENYRTIKSALPLP